MSVQATDVKSLLTQYAEDLNGAIETRDFEPVCRQWFADECSMTFRHESHGIAAAVRLWDHLLPKGESVDRSVQHEVYKVENDRVFTRRALVGGIVPKPMYGLQETQFDGRTLISEIKISSFSDKPEVDIDPALEKGRLARIFQQFSSVFDEYFQTGKKGLLDEWCSEDIDMSLDSTYYNKGVIGPHHRIGQTARFSVKEIEPSETNHHVARVRVENWGGSDHDGVWKVDLTPDGKLSRLVIGLEI
jgi:hypothetical protein